MSALVRSSQPTTISGAPDQTDQATVQHSSSATQSLAGQSGHYDTKTDADNTTSIISGNQALDTLVERAAASSTHRQRIATSPRHAHALALGALGALGGGGVYLTAGRGWYVVWRSSWARWLLGSLNSSSYAKSTSAFLWLTCLTERSSIE